MPLTDLAERLWYGDGVGARVVRGLLAPLGAMYGGVVAARNTRFDDAPAALGPIPAVSIGNLTVGGTGKTPVSAYFARRLREAGATPAIVMRGYGTDEVLVHGALNPGIRVVANPDRVRGVEDAAASGADVAILDDAFQHRRAARVADVVLLSADRWTGEVRLLPAGPFREPLASLGRARLVLVTVKAASPDRIAAAVAAASRVTNWTVVTVDLAPASFVHAISGQPAESGAFRGRRVLAVSGIGDPGAFHAQLGRMGVVVEPLVYADHHEFTDTDVNHIAERSAGVDAVVCTLKDAVKLGRHWPDSAVPLWYLSQLVIPRDGAGELDAIIQTVLAARRNWPP
ncbi:MAG: tetraacyldisaccharide 4'-kinase [Gemmatimonadaceae bacterium]|nr:tetraacyldisaccharide 4'-kinase [Gemmatimonadaceae bacterium]